MAAKYQNLHHFYSVGSRSSKIALFLQFLQLTADDEQNVYYKKVFCFKN